MYIFNSTHSEKLKQILPYFWRKDLLSVQNRQFGYHFINISLPSAPTPALLLYPQNHMEQYPLSSYVVLLPADDLPANQPHPDALNQTQHNRIFSKPPEALLKTLWLNHKANWTKKTNYNPVTLSAQKTPNLDLTLICWVDHPRTWTTSCIVFRVM